MVLTEEQRERMRKNRERALELKRKRLMEEAEKKQDKETMGENVEAIKDKDKAETKDNGNEPENKRHKVGAEQEEEEDVELEDWEVGASRYVTKTEAKKMYCLPDGTLAVCQVEERPNPRNTKFVSMKLYHRAEIRRRARKRYGGLVGLQEERRRREEKQFKKDIEKTKNIFE